MDTNALISAIPTQYVPYVTAGIAVCAAIAAVLPHPSVAPTNFGQKAYVFIYNTVNYVAFNLGNAKNAPKEVVVETAPIVVPLVPEVKPAQ